MNSFTIKDLENLSGIKAHTIRVWEQRYKFLKPCRTHTNIRYYSNDELKKILNIALLNKYGYKISHIDKMNENDIKERVLTLVNIDAQQERLILDLIECMVDMNMESFESIIDDYINAKGIERAIVQLIFPFLERTGILWLTNHINPAQEHLVSNIIRQKLICGIENISSSIKVDKSVLLFLPEDEHHELGLLFVYYLLKSRGVCVIYLGANIPLHDAAYVANYKKPDFIYSHITSAGNNFNLDKFISHCCNKFSDTPCIISGRVTNSYQKKIPSQINLKRSFPEVLNFVSTL